ncbi:MAG: right-handed parallel beta-helix repeat-containing protein [Planctomycetes bacterium]|nr:right-handed parallel beta-helix repeat-containing protein [Planctomycetota bacterium]
MRAHQAPAAAASAALSLLIWLAASPAAAAEDPHLDLIVRDSYLAGIPLLVRVELVDEGGSPARSVWDAEALLSFAGEGIAMLPLPLAITNGTGTVLIAPDSAAAGDIEITASVELPSGTTLQSTKTLASLEGVSRSEVEGTLEAGLNVWEGVIHVTGDVTAPSGATLRVEAGTLVLIDGVESGEDGKDINVEGAIECLGTAERPVTFTAADPSRPWGEIDHDDASPSLYRYTHVTRAGNSPRGGHTGTGPAIRPRGSTIHFEHCAFTDNIGKVMQASNSDLEFHRCVLARSVMGPEVGGTRIILEESLIGHMFGEINNDGNDGDAIYIHDQQAGQDVLLRDSIVLGCTDDGIDTLEADVMIDGCIVRDILCDKGISVFGGSAEIRRCLLIDNDKGVSVKSTGGAYVDIDHCTFAGNRWSVESRYKSNATSPENHITITNSIVRHNSAEDGSEGCESNEPVGGRSIRTDFDPSYITVRYSNLQEGFQVEGEFLSSWPGPGDHNIGGDPRFRSPEEHEFLLLQDSPCIDAADPDAPLDPDGSRSDMGAFPFIAGSEAPRFRRGHVNDDDGIDISDPILILLHLFAGRSIGCESAADTSDDGDIDISDAVALLGHIFQGGDPPPPPSESCGVDPTDDTLTCEMSTCP